MMATRITTSEHETESLGAELGQQLSAGAVVLLHGDLGAGKTAFVRGLATAVGISPEDVSSPTFAIVQEYAGRVPVLHVDLYRLSSREVPDLGLEELSAGRILVVEWADRMSQPPAGAVDVRISDLGGDRRAVVIQPVERTSGAAIAPHASGSHSTR